MAKGQSGKQLVALAVTATIGAIGIGTIYLPFMADRDKLRGLFEEGEGAIPEGARREIRDIMKKEAVEKERQREAEQQQQQTVQQKASAGSMWSSFRRNNQ
ncbi:hypothetical protein HJC23_001854 [Cyclotella cryptica]|uniref:Uncharacterized protein n=1 Tax=Cyclotella cryptica TaxID=29204 RepID=A0ABD3Q0B8_9STRA|eukprot:CCRYP_009902-RA/>CCRYP_009902-RA protein AED:0.01 eAED:0.01 QI:0/-1/0/1/-1/1/1/0/100